MTDPDQARTTGGRFTKWSILGVDHYGSRHIANFPKQTVHVVTADGQLEHVERLADQPRGVYDWMEFVAEGRGWLDRRYGVSLVDMAADVVEGSA